MVRKMAIASAVGAFAFLVAGPLQHVGVLPQTIVGDASKIAIKKMLNVSTEEAWACPGGGNGRGPQGNNGFGNGGGDGVPGGSRHQDRTR